MKLSIISFLMLMHAVLFAQDKNVCAIKLGGGTFINMQHIIMYHGTDVCNIKSRQDSIIVNMQFYDQSGSLIADVVNSRLTDGGKGDLTLKHSGSEFSLISKSTKQILCLIKRVDNLQAKRCELHVWMDTYLPHGLYLHCTPDENFSPQLQNIIFKGSTMSNGFTAISIN